jgi:hypothetical protein
MIDNVISQDTTGRMHIGRSERHRTGVGWVQIGVAGPAVGEAADPDLADDRGQPPLMSRLHPGVGIPVGVDDVAPALSGGPQVGVVLEEMAQQVPAVVAQPVRQLGVLQPVGPGPAQPGRQGLEGGLVPFFSTDFTGSK